MEYIDNPTGAVQPVNPEAAYMAGQFKVDDFDALRKFGEAFDLGPKTVENCLSEITEFVAGLKQYDVPSAFAMYFNIIMPEAFMPEKVKGWNANIHFKIDGGGDWTIQIQDGEMKSSKGLEGKATVTVTSNWQTYIGIMKYNLINSGDAIITVEDDPLGTTSSELEDEQLDAVVGGRGSSSVSECAGEATGFEACAAQAAGSAGSAGGVSVCAADVGACVGEVFGASACAGNLAACVADVSGVTACAGEISACVGAITGVGACAGDISACAGDVAGVSACAGNVGGCVGDTCAVDTCAGELGCVAEVCAVDASPGVDIGPCAINVIPCFPGI
jgi:hypothetical protein